MNPHSPVLPEFDGRIMDGLVFSRKVYRLFNTIRRGSHGISRLRLRRDPAAKKLVEELLPLAAFVQRRYNAGVQIRVQWRAGSQNFDAQFYQGGSAVEMGLLPKSLFAEITGAMHKNDYYDRCLIDKKGGSFGPQLARKDKFGDITSEPYVWQNHEFIQSMVSMISDAVKKKTSKTYPPNTVLIVHCHFERTPLLTEWNIVVDEVQKSVQVEPFREVFLLEAVQQFTASIYSAGLEDTGPQTIQVIAY